MVPKTQTQLFKNESLIQGFARATAPLCALLLSCCGAVYGATSETDESASPEIRVERVSDLDLWERERLTGDWWGVRTSLEDFGLRLGGSYTAEVSGVVSGGVSRRGSFRNLLALEAELDLESAFGLEGGTLYAGYLSVNPERGGSRDSGDIQIYTNLENDRHIDALYEIWYEQRLFDDRIRIKFGKMDANDEFAFVSVAEDFSHSSAGFSPTIFAFPSYPDSAFGVSVFGTLNDSEDHVRFTLGYGFFDGAYAIDGIRTGTRGPATFFRTNKSDDYFHVGQLEVEWDALGGDESAWWRDGRASVGGWAHSGRFERFNGGTTSTTGGLFVTVEQRLWASDRQGEGAGLDRGGWAHGAHLGDDEPGGGGVWVFAQYGWADSAVSEFAQHFGLGVVMRGTFAGRDDDSAGLYLSLADLSDKSGAGFDRDELAMDLYYRAQITPAVFVQPEVQYIINPSGDRSVDNAFVLGLRVGIEF